MERVVFTAFTQNQRLVYAVLYGYRVIIIISNGSLLIQLKSSGEYRPVLVAAGGGGLGLGQFFNDGAQHGQGPLQGSAVGGRATARKDSGTWINSRKYIYTVD